MINNAGVLFFFIATSPTDLEFCSVSYDTTKWNYAAGVVELGKKAVLYLDGVKVCESANVINTVYFNDLDVLIGSRENNYFINGNISEAQIWNAALPQSDIIRVMQGKHPISIDGTDDSLELWAKLDGDSHDLSGNYNDGTDIDVTYVDGVNQEVAEFNGSSGRILLGRIPTNLKIAGDLTIMAVLNFTDSGSVRFAFDTNSYGLYTSAGNISAYNRLADNSFKAISDLINYNDGNPHHVAMIKDSENMTLYIDGVEVATNSDGGVSAISTQNVFVGKASAGSSYYKGKVSDVRVYSRALTQSQIIKIKNEENY